MNSTMTTFGYPASLVTEYQHWVVLLRPVQTTLGALVLVCKEEVEAYGNISAAAHAEQGQIIQAIETALSTAFDFQKINYLMLMMVDPHVHFHVLPRYAADQSFAGQTFTDSGWPGLPELTASTDTSQATTDKLLKVLKSHWPNG